MTKRQTVYFGNSLSKLELCGKTIGWRINTSGAYQAPYETKPTTGEHDYNSCKNCQSNLKEITRVLTERFEGTDEKKGFPHCCTLHANLIKIKEYNRADFINAPELTAKKVIYTQQHIENNHKEENYYKEITDYIEYTVESFGQMPKGCGEPLYASCYISLIKGAINNNDEIKPERKQTLVDFIENSYEREENSEKHTDLNILLEMYQKWLNIFPFEMSFFGILKARFERTLPFLSGKPEVNKYSGKTTEKVHTKSSLIDALMNLTNTLITQLNSHSLYERRLLTEPDRVNLELILNERKQKLREGYSNKSQNEEQRYRKFLKAWFADEKAFFTEVTPLLITLIPQAEEDTPPDRLRMTKDEVITNKWANYELAQMRYNSSEVWHQVAGYHYVGDELKHNHLDNVLDIENFPVVTKGITAYLLHNFGNSEQVIFDTYYKSSLNKYKQVELRKPGSSMRDLDTDFYPLHVSQEKDFARFSENIHPYLSREEIELINQYVEAYFKYIEQVYSPKNTNAENTHKSKTESELRVTDWCIVFYYIDEAGTKKGYKINRMKKFIADNKVVNPSGELTTPSNFRKEYYEIENRINGKNNKKLLPPERIKNILPYLENYKEAIQNAENDIDYLNSEIEENERNTY